ncbi:MAG: hypothetical protein KDI36_04155 [Pseudomonadales bacterium]|nr:hypothetical protein [Pseudomonadales bacterium]
MKRLTVIATVLALLTGCASNEHLVFFTDTSIGIEIGSEPNSGVPAKFVVGYKRKEGVIDPLLPDYEQVSSTANAGVSTPVSGDGGVILVPNGTLAPKGSSVKPHSVLAKLNFGADASGTDATTAQWFATGKAAELIAKNPSVGGALTGDAEINKASAINTSASKSEVRTFAYLTMTYQFLAEMTKTSAEAQQIKSEIDALDTEEFRQSFAKYYWDPKDTNGKALLVNVVNHTKSKPEFTRATNYLAQLLNSIEVATEALNTPGVTVAGASISDIQQQTLRDAAALYKTRYAAGFDKLRKHPSVIKMVNYVNKNMIIESTSAGE